MLRSPCIILLFFCVLLAQSAWADPPPHPRLIIDDTKIAELYDLTHPDGDWTTWTDREKVSHLAYRSIIESANYYMEKAWNSSTWVSSQGKQYRGLMTLALAHLLRKDEVEPQPYDNRYAQKLLGGLPGEPLGLLLRWRDNGYPNHGGDLGHAELTAGWALVFDWLFDEMGVYQYDVADAVLDLETLLTNTEHHTFSNCWSIANNHVGIDYSARGLAALALEGHATDEQNRVAILDEAAYKVRGFLNSSYFNEGSAVEGMFYAQYGLNVALPFALATDRLPHLDPDHRMRVAEECNVQQAGTWMLYEQLPYLPYAGTQLNDVATPPYSMNHTVWVSWPWLMAFGNIERPSGALHHFYTQYSPAKWDNALGYDFDPDSSTNPSGGLLFSHNIVTPPSQPQLPLGEPYYVPASILLSLPDIDGPLPEFVGPAEMRSSRAFEGQGLTYFRSSLHDVVGGELQYDPLATMIVFQARRHWWYEPGCEIPSIWPLIHVHHDLHHFLVYTQGEKLFYDTGMHTRRAEGHSNCEIWDSGQNEWISAEEDYLLCYGQPMPTLLPGGNAPMMAGGDKTEVWPTLADRAQRYFFVMPRTGDQPPYILFHDDIDYTGSETGRVRWHWQSGARMSDPEFVITEETGQPTQASLQLGDARGTATMLSPLGSTVSAGTIDPEHPSWPDMRQLAVETPEQENADQVVMIEIENTTGGAIRPDHLAAEELFTGFDGRFAWLISDGERRDLVAVRRADDTDTWQLNVDGHSLSTDAHHVILRYNDDGLEWDSIDAGLFTGGSFVYYDQKIVMGVDYNGFGQKPSMSFSSDEVAVRTNIGTYLIGYIVGPVIPESAFINRQVESVTMLPRPHPLTSVIPDRVGRSPNNIKVHPDYRYVLDIELNDGNSADVQNWSSDDIYLRIAWELPNYDQHLLPDDVDPVTGVATWFEALSTGGSGEARFEPPVAAYVNYGSLGWGMLTSWPTLTSPDQNGNGYIDRTDHAIWRDALQNGEPLYIGDLNFDDVIDAADFDWILEHTK